MTASDHCSSREKTLANRGPSTHEAALLLEEPPQLTLERIVSVDLTGQSRPALGKVFQAPGFRVALCCFRQAETFRLLIQAVLRAVHERRPQRIQFTEQYTPWGTPKFPSLRSSTENILGGVTNCRTPDIFKIGHSFFQLSRNRPIRPRHGRAAGPFGVHPVQPAES
jgi:hypothetical protein